MERIIAIIRINYKELDQEIEDLKRLNKQGLHNIAFSIPKVIVLKRSIKGAHEFQEKPLLFNYGFLEIPLEYASDQNKLSAIRSNSRIIMGFFYRKPDALRLEKKIAEADGLGEWHPFLIKTVEQQEVERLFQVAREINVYDTIDELAIGSFILLKGYPFDGMAAEVIAKRSNGKMQVELVDSGIKVWLETGNVYFSVYSGDEYNMDLA